MTKQDFAAYKKIPAINWSSLKHMKRSPLHFKHASENERADTTRLARGRASHTAVFEIERFMLEYACFDGERRQGKRWDAFKEMHEGKTILKVDEYRECVALREAVRSHPVASNILQRGECEKTIKWVDAATGLPCKARIDWLSARHELADLKTTNDVNADRFGRTAARMLYHAQLAMYADGVEAVTGKAPTVFLIAAEIDAPHDVAVFDVDADSLCAGREEYRALLRMVVECEKNERWPGAYQEITPLLLPAYVFGDEDGFTATDLSTGEVFDNG